MCVLYSGNRRAVLTAMPTPAISRWFFKTQESKSLSCQVTQTASSERLLQLKHDIILFKRNHF